MSEDATHDRILQALDRLEGRLTSLEQKVDALAAPGADATAAPAVPGAGGSTALDQALARPDVAEGLARIVSRIDALEQVAMSLETLVERAPILIEGGAEVVDHFMGQAAEQGIDVFERGERGAVILEKASRPGTLDLADRLLDDQVVAGLGKLTDRGAAVLTSPALDKLVASGLMDPDKLEATIDALDRLAAVTTTPEFSKLLDSGLLDPQVLGVAGSATTALVEVKGGSVEPVGLFGTLGKLGDPDVKKAMGFLFAVAKRFGAKL